MFKFNANQSEMANKLQGSAKKVPLIEFCALVAARQTDQPMHSQSAKFGKFKLNSLNLAPFLSLNPVHQGCTKRIVQSCGDGLKCSAADQNNTDRQINDSRTNLVRQPCNLCAKKGTVKMCIFQQRKACHVFWQLKPFWHLCCWRISLHDSSVEWFLP